MRRSFHGTACRPHIPAAAKAEPTASKALVPFLPNFSASSAAFSLFFLSISRLSCPSQRHMLYFRAGFSTFLCWDRGSIEEILD